MKWYFSACTEEKALATTMSVCLPLHVPLLLYPLHPSSLSILSRPVLSVVRLLVRPVLSVVRLLVKASAVCSSAACEGQCHL